MMLDNNNNNKDSFYLAYVIAHFVITLIVFSICYYADYKYNKPRVIYAPTNQYFAQYFYQITLSSGIQQSRLTDTFIYIKLIGSKCDSSVHCLQQTSVVTVAYQSLIEYSSIGRGEIKSFLIRENNHLGNIEAIKIWHELPNSKQNSNSATTTTGNKQLYINYIIVFDIYNKESFTFLCYKWLSPTSERPIESLAVMVSHEIENGNFVHKLICHMTDTLLDDNVFVSLIFRPQNSFVPRVYKFILVTFFSCVNMIVIFLQYSSEAKLREIFCSYLYINLTRILAAVLVFIIHRFICKNFYMLQWFNRTEKVSKPIDELLNLSSSHDELDLTKSIMYSVDILKGAERDFQSFDQFKANLKGHLYYLSDELDNDIPPPDTHTYQQRSYYKFTETMDTSTQQTYRTNWQSYLERSTYYKIIYFGNIAIELLLISVIAFTFCYAFVLFTDSNNSEIKLNDCDNSNECNKYYQFIKKHVQYSLYSMLTYTIVTVLFALIMSLSNKNHSFAAHQPYFITVPTHDPHENEIHINETYLNDKCFEYVKALPLGNNKSLINMKLLENEWVFSTFAITAFILFMVVSINLAYSNMDIETGYYSNSFFSVLFHDAITSVNEHEINIISHNEFMRWLNDSIVPLIFGEREGRHKEHPNRSETFFHICFTPFYLVNSLQFTQIRTVPRQCDLTLKIIEHMKNQTLLDDANKTNPFLCVEKDKYEDKHFGTRWGEQVGNLNQTNKTNFWYLQAYLHKITKFFENSYYSGVSKEYNQNGYKLLMDINHGKFINDLQQFRNFLKEESWIDHHTNVLIVEANAYNPHSNSWTVIQVSSENSGFGPVITKVKFSSFSEYNETLKNDWRRFFNEYFDIFYGYLVIYALHEGCQLCDSIREYGIFKGLWKNYYSFENILDLFILIFTSLIKAHEIFMGSIVRRMNEYQTSSMKTMDHTTFTKKTVMKEYLNKLYIILNFANFLKALNLLKCNHKTYLITGTLSEGFVSLTYLIVIMFMNFCILGLIGFNLFHFDLQFSDTGTAITTSLLSVVKHLDFQQMVERDFFQTVIWMLFAWYVAHKISVAFVLSVIITKLRVVREKQKKSPKQMMSKKMFNKIEEYFTCLKSRRKTQNDLWHSDSNETNNEEKSSTITAVSN